jgi:excisionase family DNA binding protein
MSPDQILDRTEACQTLGISRQTLMSWIRKGKLKVWKRVGAGTNAALLFERKHVETFRRPSPAEAMGSESPATDSSFQNTNS